MTLYIFSYILLLLTFLSYTEYKKPSTTISYFCSFFHKLIHNLSIFEKKLIILYNIKCDKTNNERVYIVKKENKNIDINQDTHHLIIRVSYRLFMELGYRKVSTRMIAEQCGITQPALYHHFKNKQQIYIEVINHSIKQTEESLIGIIKQYETLEKRLLHIALYFMANYQEDLIQMFHDLQHEMPKDVQIQIKTRWQKGFLQPIIDILDTAVEINEIAPFETYNSNTMEIAYIFLQYIQTVTQPSSMRELSEEQQMIVINKKAHLIVHLFLHGISNEKK